MTLKSALGALFESSRLNVTNSRNNGFILEGKVKCSGLTKKLERCFYSNFSAPSSSSASKKKKVTPRGGKRIGNQFHRQVYHHFKCGKKPKDCSCPSRFQVRGRTLPARPGSIVHKRLEAFDKFLADHGWQVLECELVAGLAECKCATAIDVVCVDSLKSPTRVFIVELKTGYKHTRQRAQGFMLGEAGGCIPNSYTNHHQLQLWFEMHAFERTYGIRPSAGAVVYINDVGGKKMGYDVEYFGSKAPFNQNGFKKMVEKQFIEFLIK